MALGSLSKFHTKHAWFVTEVPSTGQKIHYRAMVMKENMEISLAATNDPNGAGMATIFAILQDCIQEEIDLTNNPMFDIEWILLQIQKKAQGEVKEVNVDCVHCKKECTAKLDLEKLRVKNLEEAKKSKTIKIDRGTDSPIYVDMKFPSMKMKEAIDSSEGDSDDPKKYYASLLEICSNCVERIYDEEDVILASEVPIEEIKEFVMQLDAKSFAKISGFFEVMPKTVIDLEFVCKHCKQSNKIEVADTTNFF